VRDVIGLGDPVLTRDDARLRRAAEAAGLGPFLDGLPEGLDTRVGRRFEGGKEPVRGALAAPSLARAREAPTSSSTNRRPPSMRRPKPHSRRHSPPAAGRRTVIVVTRPPELVDPRLS
jgi:hypothetical protein